jgi:hypothetical protein
MPCPYACEWESFSDSEMPVRPLKMIKCSEGQVPIHGKLGQSRVPEPRILKPPEFSSKKQCPYQPHRGFTCPGRRLRSALSSCCIRFCSAASASAFLHLPLSFLQSLVSDGLLRSLSGLLVGLLQLSWGLPLTFCFRGVQPGLLYQRMVGWAAPTQKFHPIRKSQISRFTHGQLMASHEITHDLSSISFLGWQTLQQQPS